MADGSISFDATLSTKQLETELKRVRSKILRLKEDVYARQSGELPLVKKMEELDDAAKKAQDRLERIKAMDIDPTAKAKMSGDQYAKIYDIEAQREQAGNALTQYIAKTTELEERIKAQQGIEAEITREIESRAQIEANAAAQAEEAARAAQEAAEAEAQAAREAAEHNNEEEKTPPLLERIQAKAKEAADGIAQMEGSGKASTNALEKLGNRMIGLAKRVFVFSLITKALRGMRSWLGDIIMQNNEARAAVARLQGALLTLAQPIINVIIPAFTAFVNILTRVIAVIASVVSRLFGTTVDKSAAAAKALNQQVKGYKGVGKAAKEASKSIMAFDELNTLQKDDDSNGSGKAGGITPDFSALDSISTAMTDWIEGLGPVLMLVIGALLFFSGVNIPLGLGLMILGGYLFAKHTIPNWDSMNPLIQQAITGILLTTGIAFFIIGAILAFSGANIPLGIGMMVYGATEIAIAAALNWDKIKNTVMGTVATIELLLGAALLGIGAVLVFSGVSLPLGIAMMAAGAIGLARSQTVDWHYMENALRGPIGAITAIVSGALLVLGVILVLTGVGVPIGMGLIFAGVAGLVTVAAINWNAISDKLKEVWSGIASWARQRVFPYFTIAFWQDKFSSIGNAFALVVTGVRNDIRALVNDLLQVVLGGISNIGDTISAISGGLVGWHIDIPQIPMLAQGAVIPPNHQFMAVLGDQTNGRNLEAPENLIRQIVREESGAGNNFEMQDRMDRMISIMERILEKTGVYLDGEELANGLAPHMRVINMERGW